MPTPEQLQQLRAMSPENRRNFHLNRIAGSLEGINLSLKRILDQLQVESKNPPS